MQDVICRIMNDRILYLNFENSKKKIKIIIMITSAGVLLL